MAFIENFARKYISFYLVFLFMGIHSATCFSQRAAIREDEQKVAIVLGDQIMLAYNKLPPPLPPGIDPVYRRSGFLHPVNTPNGKTVTAAYPVDHPHQSGIFTAWVRAIYDGNEVDFWNLAGGTGRVLHHHVIARDKKGNEPGFSVELTHRAYLPNETGTGNQGERVKSGPIAIDVLRETWIITLVDANEEFTCFDIEMTQRALTDKPLTVQQYHYGGAAVRGPADWLVEGKAGEVRGAEEAISYFLNSLGSDRKQGNHEHAKWVTLTGMLQGSPATIAVLCHKDNFRAPQAARLHPTKPYFCYAACVDGEFVIDRDKPFRSRYRYIVSDSQPDGERLDQLWKQWMEDDARAQ